MLLARGLLSWEGNYNSQAFLHHISRISHWGVIVVAFLFPSVLQIHPDHLKGHLIMGDITANANNFKEALEVRSKTWGNQKTNTLFLLFFWRVYVMCRSALYALGFYFCWRSRFQVPLGWITFLQAFVCLSVICFILSGTTRHCRSALVTFWPCTTKQSF